MIPSPFKKTWYSVCSAHRDFEPGCPTCKVGHWRNDWSRAIGNVFYKLAPDLWKWWVNRKPLKFQIR